MTDIHFCSLFLQKYASAITLTICLCFLAKIYLTINFLIFELCPFAIKQPLLPTQCLNGSKDVIIMLLKESETEVGQFAA